MVEKFKYLDHIAKQHGIGKKKKKKKKVNRPNNIQSVWNYWKKVSGVLCNRKMKVKLRR